MVGILDHTKAQKMVTSKQQSGMISSKPLLVPPIIPDAQVMSIPSNHSFPTQKPSSTIVHMCSNNLVKYTILRLVFPLEDWGMVKGPEDP